MQRQQDLFSDQAVPVDTRKTYLIFQRYKTAILKQDDWASECAVFLAKSSHDFTIPLQDIPTELIDKEDLLSLGFKVIKPEPTQYAFNNPTIRNGYYCKDRKRWIPYQSYRAKTRTNIKIIGTVDLEL